MPGDWGIEGKAGTYQHKFKHKFRVEDAAMAARIGG